MKNLITKFNEIKKEVKLANPELESYLVVAIASVVFAQSKISKPAIDENLLELKSDFWDAHRSSKKRSNEAKIRQANTAKLNIAQKIVKSFSEQEISKVFGDYADFVLKIGTRGYIPTLNGYGKLGSFISFN